MRLGRKIASFAGIDLPEGQTPESAAKQARFDEEYPTTYLWVRRKLDTAIQEYQMTGNPAKLAAFCRPLQLKQIRAYVDQANAAGFLWSHPDRFTSQFKFEVIDETMDEGTGKPLSFVVQEAFSDQSIFDKVDERGAVLEKAAERATGERVVIRLTLEPEPGEGNTAWCWLAGVRLVTA